ncbi:MAG: hypothetical protein IT384_18430 [Deltaproteobacteria bacterium]|nr:hypothetical protein [Deltaproteobacteria bacterium]
MRASLLGVMGVMGVMGGAALVGGCGDYAETTLLWYLKPCQGPFPRLCPVERNVDGQVQIVYAGVADHDLTWGVEADVEYQVESADTHFADEVDVWRVRKVLATRTAPLGSLLIWSQPRNETWFTAAGEHVDAYGTAVACEPAVCNQLTTIDPVADRTIDLEYTGDPSLPLRALAVRAQ